MLNVLLPAHRRDLAVLALVGAAMFAVAGYLPGHPFVDEYAHWPQAQSLARGSWALDPGISTWPTMNAVVGWTLALLGQTQNLLAGRLVIVAFGLLALAGFMALAREFDAEAARLRTAQFFLSPVVLPFCALVYTDVPALACLLWAAVGALRRQAWLLIGAGLFACAFRQSNIIWFVAFCGLFGWLVWQAGERPTRTQLAAALAVVAAWLAVVLLQGGIASGAYTQADHPGTLKGIPNLWYGLVVAAIVYLPYFLFRLLRDAPGLRLWQVGALAALVLATFEVTHRFNLIEAGYFLHNALLLQTFKRNGMALFVLTAVLMAPLVWRTPFARHASLRLPLLGVSAASLLPFWLMEPRYDLPILALFWAARARVDARVEYAQLAFGGFCSVWVILRIARGVLFV